MFNPSLHTATNKPIGLINKPVDSRTYYYDDVNFVYRAYVSTAEVLAYLAGNQRVGQFSIIINSGGAIVDGVITGGTNSEWWFKDGISDADLQYKGVTGGVAWGDISGDINNQVDLINLLDGYIADGDAAGGDLGGTYPNPSVETINGITTDYYDPTSSIQDQLDSKTSPQDVEDIISGLGLIGAEEITIPSGTPLDSGNLTISYSEYLAHGNYPRLGLEWLNPETGNWDVQYTGISKDYVDGELVNLILFLTNDGSGNSYSYYVLVIQ